MRDRLTFQDHNEVVRFLWQRRSLGGMQRHVDMDGVERKDRQAVIGPAEDTRIEQRMHVTVRRLHIKVHAAQPRGCSRDRRR